MSERANSTPPVGYVWAPKLARIEDGVLFAAQLRESTARRPAPALRHQLRDIRVWRRPDRSLLEQFCRMAESGNLTRSVTAFAKKWGLFQLCEPHSLPAGHDGASCSARDTVEGYWKFAVGLNALLKLGKDISARRWSSISDWQEADRLLCGRYSAFPQLESLDLRFLTDSEPFTAYRTRYVGPSWPQGMDLKSAPSLKVDREKIAEGPPTLIPARTRYQTLIRRLVDVSGLVPRFHWNPEARSWAIDFDAEYRPSNLAAILAIQIMTEIAGGIMRKCRACPQFFCPKGRQVYCIECGKPAAHRAAQRALRERAKGKM
jgi:hypothetical protein